jgi:acyl carrier protein
MADSELDSLRRDLKAMIIRECGKDIAPEELTDDERLIGGPLELDSLDALQICLAVVERYGVRIEGGKAAHKALVSVTTLAETIVAAKATT